MVSAGAVLRVTVAVVRVVRVVGMVAEVVTVTVGVVGSILRRSTMNHSLCRSSESV
jgi:hypothetical protein